MAADNENKKIEKDSLKPDNANNSDNTEHGNVKAPNKPRKESWYQNLVWRFIVFAVISALVTFGIMIYANWSLRKSHDAIISEYQRSMILTNSLLNDGKTIEPVNSHGVVGNKLLAKRLEDAATNLASLENDQKTLHLLELEFSKIQNEYEVLNLWCALLTVVFLIFSFFSLIKTNELSRQGEEALTNLKTTASEAEKKSASIDTTVKEAEKRIKGKEEEFITNFGKKIEEDFKPIKKRQEELFKLVESKLSEIKSLESNTEKLNRTLDDRIKEIRESIPKTLTDFIQKEAERLWVLESERVRLMEENLKKLTKRMDNIDIEYENEYEDSDSKVDIQEVDEIEKMEEVDEMEDENHKDEN